MKNISKYKGHSLSKRHVMTKNLTIRQIKVLFAK